MCENYEKPMWKRICMHMCTYVECMLRFNLLFTISVVSLWL